LVATGSSGAEGVEGPHVAAEPELAARLTQPVTGYPCGGGPEQQGNEHGVEDGTHERERSERAQGDEDGDCQAVLGHSTALRAMSLISASVSQVQRIRRGMPPSASSHPTPRSFGSICEAS